MIFTSGENVSSHFEKGEKDDNVNVFNGNPSFVAFYLKSLQTIKIMMTLRRGFYKMGFYKRGLSL